MRKFHIKHNYIVYLGMSYATVLLVPLLVIIIGVSALLHLYSNQVRQSDIDKIKHSIQLIDGELTNMTYMVTQVVQNPDIQASAKLDTIDRASMLQYQKGIAALQNITKYGISGLREQFYVYFNKVDAVLYDSSLYHADLFEKYLSVRGISLEEWHDRIVSPSLTEGNYVRSQSGQLQYIQPINGGGADGTNDGVMVFAIDEGKLSQYFSAFSEYEDYAIYIADRNSNLLYQKENNPARVVDLANEAKPFPEEKDSNVVSLTSAYYGWKYYVVFPRRALLDRMALVYFVGISAGFLTIGLMLALMIGLSVRIGRPIDDLFTLVDKEHREQRNSEKFSEIVEGIVNSNEHLREQLEKNKPMRRKAFFHDLLSMDVTSPKELAVMAENVGVNIRFDRFCIVSVKLFANNDFYEIDEQTLGDARVILQFLAEKLEQEVGENVWSYQRNFLSTLFIFGGVSVEEVETLAVQLRKWIQETFHSETNWGISRQCDNILNMWKHCEEAETACDHCSINCHIVRYTADLEDKKGFYFPETAEERVGNAVRAGNQEAVKDILDIIYRENFEHRNMTRNSLMKLNGRLTDLMVSLQIEEDSALPYIMQLNDQVIRLEQFRREDYFAIVREGFANLCSAVSREKNFQKSQLAAEIQGYIMENWQNADLGIPVISHIYQISEGYVSTLFKEQVGVNFLSYVEHVRLEHACEFLESTDKNIDEISSMVGYNSVQSFRRAFKRVCGLSPNEYRRKKQEERR